MICNIKEPDTFPTTYAKDFIWHKNHTAKSHLSSGFDAFALTLKEKKAFIDLNAIKEIPWDEQLEIIKQLYAERLKTTYYVSYSERGKKDDISKGKDLVEDEDILLSNAEKLFSVKTQKVLEPPPTSRRVMGYCRPTFYYTGLSEYQDKYSRSGYKTLAITGGSRMKHRLPFCEQFKS